MKLLVYVEQYDVVGILPSQLESIAHLVTAMGITEAAYIDNTADGFSGIGGFTRYASLAEFIEHEHGPFVAFSPDTGEDIRTLNPPAEAWLVFGPAMGWSDVKFDKWAKIPGGVLNSRDAVPIAVWETSKWRAQ